MVKRILAAAFYFMSICCSAQITDLTSTGKELYETANNYLLTGDFPNAIMVFNQAVQAEPKNIIYRRELARAYYLQGDLTKAELTIKPILKLPNADAETFLIAGKIYARMQNLESAKEAIQTGIEKFPATGVLYEQKGQLCIQQKNYKEAAQVWELGIEKNPGYPLNYFNLAKTYFVNKQYARAIVYAEHFIDMESFSNRTEELKNILFDSYKFLIADLNNNELKKGKKSKREPETFEECWINTLDHCKNVVSGGINTENLTMLRIRFLLEWNKWYAQTFPLELIDYQQRLVLNGYYDAYNVWLFGRADNEKRMKLWTQNHSTLMNDFDTYFRSNKLEPKLNQYYQN